MKKMLLVLFILCLMLCGCSKQEKENFEDSNGTIINATWDHEEFTSIIDMNKNASTNIACSSIDGKENESFIVISGNIAQYKFTLNDENWSVRASTDVDNDISGLYYDNITFEKDVESTYYNDDVYMHRFFYDNVQYVITLDVKDKDIEMSYFDKVSADIQTEITGVQAGYETEIVEEDGNVVFRSFMHNSDGTTTILEYIYVFDGDKMVSILNNIAFETEDAAKSYYNELIEAGSNPESITLEGLVISSKSEDVDFYSDYTKEEFIDMMKSSLAQ